MRRFTKYPSNYVKASMSNERIWDLGYDDGFDVTWDVYDNITSIELQTAIDEIGFHIYSDDNFWWVSDLDVISDNIFDILYSEMSRLYPKCIYTEM